MDLSYFYFAHNHPRSNSAGLMSGGDAATFSGINGYYNNSVFIIYYKFKPYEKHAPFQEGY